MSNTMEWNEELLGVRPVEGHNGSFKGRETFVAPFTCPCQMPTSYYAEPENGEEHEICWEQTEALRSEFARAFIESLMAEDESDDDDDDGGFSLLELLLGTAGMAIIQPTEDGISITTMSIRPLNAVDFNELFSDEESE